MKIIIKTFSIPTPVAVFVGRKNLKNGYNVNPKLDWRGKAIKNIKGTWSSEKLEASYGNY